jgi:hypothetical protein
VLKQQIEALLAAGIQHVPMESMPRHFVLERDGFVSLVERTETGFGAVGAPGMLTEKGFAALVWRAGSPFFVAHGFEQRASTEQVEDARRFAHDIETALHSA